ncbi:hypothetical protein CPAV1605_394 [seawater metagenome]|uniref:Uncharacterized protein n=1 Tax=seawater metagenome TaxID=1561972 RepID=A0A5E8CJ74_9ZZZZ
MFLKIQHSSVKINDINFQDIEIISNKIINKKSNNIIKEISDLSFDNNLYKIEIEKDKLGKTLIIYIKINIEECENLIQSGIVIPHREMFFKLLSVHHLTGNNLNKFNFNYFQNIIDKKLDSEMLVFPHHLMTVGQYFYDLKFHRIQKKYDSLNCILKGGIIQTPSAISILQLLKPLNEERCLFVVNNDVIDLYKNIADSFNDGRNIIVLSNIQIIEEEELLKYNNIFVTVQVIKKYYMTLLKEYISKSKNIDFIDSLENMINDNNISTEIGDHKKFFNQNWNNLILTGDLLNSKKFMDIIISIKAERKWILIENKVTLENTIKPILRILTPTKKIPENLQNIKENIIYYKSTNEIPFLKVSSKDSTGYDIVSLKHFILNHKFYNYDNTKFKEDMNVNYKIENIYYEFEDYTLELFKLCNQYNKLEIFYYFMNPTGDSDISSKIKFEVKHLEDNLKNLLQKEKLEEFKLKLALHEKMDNLIIHNIKKNLEAIYDEIEEKENKIILLNKNINTVEKVNTAICPISYEKIEPNKNCASTVCNHQFNFRFLLESLFNDKRCPLCRYQLDYKQVNIGFSLDVKDLLEKINYIISNNQGKVVIVSKFESQLMFLKKNLPEKPVSLISYINLQKIIKFNESDKKVLLVSRKLFTYELSYINSNRFIFCESIWDDELDEYFLIREYFKKNELIEIDILTPNI